MWRLSDLLRISRFQVPKKREVLQIKVHESVTVETFNESSEGVNP